MDINIDGVYGKKYVTVEGTVNKIPFFFHAREASWSIGIGKYPISRPLFYRQVAYDGLFEISKNEIWKFIQTSCQQFLEENRHLDTAHNNANGANCRHSK